MLPLIIAQGTLLIILSKRKLMKRWATLTWMWPLTYTYYSNSKWTLSLVFISEVFPDMILYLSVLNPAFDHISNLKCFTEQEISPHSDANTDFHLNQPENSGQWGRSNFSRVVPSHQTTLWQERFYSFHKHISWFSNGPLNIGREVRGSWGGPRTHSHHSLEREWEGE